MRNGETWSISIGIDSFGVGGYYVSTVGKQKKVIERYIENQLKEDAMSEELTLNFEDPFTGSKK